MRALPADSLAYFGSTALGNTAPPDDLVAVTGLLLVFVSVAAAAPEHSVFRNSFHDFPFKVPADFAD